MSWKFKQNSSKQPDIRSMHCIKHVNHHRHFLVEMHSPFGLCQTSHPLGGMVYSLQTLKWIIRWIIHWIIQDLLVLAKRHTSIILFRYWGVQLKGLRQLKEIFETEITLYYFHKDWKWQKLNSSPREWIFKGPNSGQPN